MTMAKKKITPETRAALREIRSEIQALIKRLESKFA